MLDPHAALSDKNGLRQQRTRWGQTCLQQPDTAYVHATHDTPFVWVASFLHFKSFSACLTVDYSTYFCLIDCTPVAHTDMRPHYHDGPIRCMHPSHAACMHVRHVFSEYVPDSADAAIKQGMTWFAVRTNRELAHHL